MRDQELRDQIAALFRSPPGVGRLGDEPPGTIADAVIELIGPILERLGAAHYTPYVDEEHQGGYCYDLFVRLLGAKLRVESERDLLLWLHAEAAWQRDVAHSMLERMETEHVTFRGPDGEEIHPYWCRECRVQALKDAIADIDRHATPMGLLNNDDPDGSPHHYLLTVGALHRALGKAYTAEPCEAERMRLRAEVERLRREVEFEANAVDWPWVPRGVCACVTDEQAAALSPRFSRPVCAVHPEGTP